MTNELSCQCIEDRPQYFNFAEGYCETWDIPMNLSEQEIENEEYMPLMNYIYSLPDDFQIPDDWRDKLENMTIIEVDNKYFLGLTSIGQDNSWEICQTYVNLGYYPPAYFCSLPRLAGRGLSRKDRHIINCCKKSLRIAVNWQKSRLGDLRAFFSLKSLKGEQ